MSTEQLLCGADASVKGGAGPENRKTMLALRPAGLTALRGLDGVKMFCHPKDPKE